jgi:hypothetical protein
MRTHAYAWPAHCTPLAGQRVQMSSVLDGRHACIVFSSAACKYAHALELMWCEAYTTTQGRHGVPPLLSGSAVWTLRAPLAGVTLSGPRNMSGSWYARTLHALHAVCISAGGRRRGLGSARILQSAGTGTGEGTAQCRDHAGQSTCAPSLHQACWITVQVHMRDWRCSVIVPGRVREHQHAVCTHKRMPRPARMCHTCAPGAPLPAPARARATGRARRLACGEVTTIAERCHVVQAACVVPDCMSGWGL